ncbi:hypothetical protein MSAN_02274000 [Mycena sanguinolenta]|uniref:Uncharacterized protein n=1 Tax=Mycena sanguinolenta TaxID=230812 RepID=A0A8H6XAY1_9AGAR|nr:hypothetical protein MSAN_02274000 [Mycena sanguinolenta]
MKFSTLLVLVASIASTQAAVNGPCTGGGLASGVGVCISTSSCSAGGGTIHSGLCPDDPEDIKCCTKSPCTSSSLGGGCIVALLKLLIVMCLGLCPGPSSFKCCAPCTAAERRDGELNELDKRLPIC